MSAPRLRDAGLDDLPALLALEAGFPSDRLSPRSLRRLLRAPSARVCVAELPGQPVAGALVLLTRRGSRRARIYSLVVHPACRGRGLGQALVRHAEALARAAGCSQLSLEVRGDNLAARSLYAGLGFMPVRELPGYYEDGADGRRLEKALSAD